MATSSVIHLVERSKSAVVSSIRKYFPQQVTQDELETLLLLEEQLKTRLELGATVEEGAHVAVLKKHFRRSGKHTVSLEIK